MVNELLKQVRINDDHYPILLLNDLTIRIDLQEEAFTAAYDSLKDDRNRLNHEVRRLQREVERLKVLINRKCIVLLSK